MAAPFDSPRPSVVLPGGTEVDLEGGIKEDGKWRGRDSLWSSNSYIDCPLADGMEIRSSSSEA